MATAHCTFSYDTDLDRDIDQALKKCDPRSKSTFIRQALRVYISGDLAGGNCDPGNSELRKILELLEGINSRLEGGLVAIRQEGGSEEEDYLAGIMDQIDQL